MAKKITGYLKLQVPAGSATPSPPIGPALGQRGLNIMEFCKAFNATTADQEKGAPTPVVITIFADKSFSFETRLPPVTYFIKKSLNLKSGSKLPGKDSAGTITQKQIREIAEKKMKDLNAYDIEQAMKHDRRLRPVHGHPGGGLTMTHIGKRTAEITKGVDRKKLYALDEAVKMVKDRAKAKFDETVEVAMNLGVDPRHADQMVRGVVNLPNGTGKNVRVAVFAKDAKAEEARKAGADIVGAEDLVAAVQAGKLDFDRVIATPDMMPLVGRLGKVLGPRNLMPNPKVGTVTPDVAGAVKAAKGGAVEFRVEKAGIIQAGVGKASFTEAALLENIKAFTDAVQKAKPAGAKGTYVKRVAVSSTMGPGVHVDPTTLNA